MAENNVDQVIVKEAEAVQQPETPKKRVRIGFIFLAVTPIAALISIQSMCQMPFLFLTSIYITQNGLAEGITDTAEGTALIMKVFNERYGFYAYMAYAAVSLITFSLWYYFGIVRRNPKVKISQVFGVKSVLATIGAVIGLNFVITAGFVLAQYLFPSVMESYAELMNASGLGSNALITIVYGIVLGPVFEELCCRGLCFGYLEKSGIKPIFMILISGILFGAMHLNLVQGIYASLLGFMLGFLRYKYRSILITIFMHILFNIMGTYGDQMIEKLHPSDGVTLILGGLSLFLLVFVIVLINGDKKAVHALPKNTEDLS